MRNNGCRIGRINGVEVRATWGIAAIGAVLVLGLAAGRFPAAAPGLRPLTYAIVATVTTGLFLGTILAHELAHAVAARRAGLRAGSITLWFLGGFTSIDGSATTPRAEATIAAAGPLTSLGIAAACAGLALAAAWAGSPRLAVDALSYLALINGALGLFNLLPAAPLDGGRILRAAFWARSPGPSGPSSGKEGPIGDEGPSRSAALDRATVAAGRVGAGVGGALVLVGVVALACGVGGADAIWLALMGLFLRAASRAESAAAAVHASLDGLMVGDVMSAEVVSGPGWFTVGAFLAGPMAGTSHTAIPIERFAGGWVGLVGRAALEAVPEALRAQVRAMDVAIPLDRIAVGRPEEPVADLVARLTPGSGGRALVFDGDRLAGIITSADVERVLRRPVVPLAQ